MWPKEYRCGLKKSELSMSNVADNGSCPTVVSDSLSYRMCKKIVACDLGADRYYGTDRQTDRASSSLGF